MTLLWLFLAASALFGLGYCLGAVMGRQAGIDDAYEAIERHYEDR